MVWWEGFPQERCTPECREGSASRTLCTGLCCTGHACRQDGDDRFGFLVGKNDPLCLGFHIEGEQGGISKEVNWQGGGSFVYCELAKLNQTIVEEIEASTDDTTLSDIYGRMVKSGFISYKVNPADIDAAADDYAALSLNDKKRFLMEILDKNLLYVNYCDIDDEEFDISDEDKAFTRSFYREG